MSLIRAQPKEVIFEDVLVPPALVADGCEWSCFCTCVGGEQRRPELCLCPPASNALSFRLSRAPERCWTACPRRAAQVPGPGPSLGHKPPEFGICDYQVSAVFLLLMTLDASVVQMLTGGGGSGSRPGRTLHRRIIPVEPDFSQPSLTVLLSSCIRF